MSSTQITILLSIVAYFVLMFLMGLFSSHNQTHSGFIIGSRDVGYIPTLGSLAASFRDGSGIVFWVGFGVSIGYGGLWLFVGVMIGLLFFAICGAKIREFAKEKDYITISEIIRNELGAATSKISAFLVLIFCLLAISMQLYVSGNIISTIVSIPAWVGVVSAASIVGFYLFLGGYSAVVKTDAIQFFLILSLIVIAFISPPPKDVLLNFGSFLDIGFKDATAFVLFGALYMLASADTWQRVFSARNKKVINISFPLAGIFLVFMTLALLFLGMSAKPLLEGDIAANDIFFAIFEQNVFSIATMAFIAVVTMAITMSTLDTACYLFTATLAKAFLPADISKTRERYIRFSQIIFVMILTTMSILALMISDVIQFMFNAISLITILAPVHLLVGFRLLQKAPRLDILIAGSVIASAIVYLVMFYLGYMEDFMMMLVPAGLSFVLCGISLLGFQYIIHRNKNTSS